MRKLGPLFTLLAVFMSAMMLNGQEVLKGGNMESVDDWQVSILNSTAGYEAVATWNYTADVPASGAGGALHVSGNTNSTTNGNTQYCIYQTVHLSADSLYTFDGAVKELTGAFTYSWIEVFISTTAPVDGEDFGADGPIRIAHFSFWDPCNAAGIDGTFQMDGCDHEAFIPEATGDYYFVLKMGTTDWEGTDKPLDLLVDEISLVKSASAPITVFSADPTTGFVSLDVQFTDESRFADSWAWDFGDGNSSTDQNPVHTYTTVGTYSVALTATNEEGSTVETKTDYINVNEKPALPAGEQLYGGNMESSNFWSVSTLDSKEGAMPSVEWNYTTDTPANGAGGALHITGATVDGNVQYCIFQEVTLSSDSLYTFDAAVKDLTASFDQSWMEVFISTTAPVDGADFGADGPIKIAQFNAWDVCSAASIDGTFLLDGCHYGGFIPAESGMYYFVLKTGTTTWTGDEKVLDILLDEVSLMSSASKPFTSFGADIQNGFDPLTVQFTDMSDFASSWAWDFGDGTSSTEQNPSHTFTGVGQYTVSLTASNDVGDSTMVKTDFITVNSKPGLPKGEQLYGGNMEDPNFWTITTLNANSIPTATWNYTDQIPAQGAGGCLRVEATTTNATAQYCIWQAVELSVDSVYTFDAAFKDLGVINQFWFEVYIGTDAPMDGADYGIDQTLGGDAALIAYLNTWESCVLIDGTFQDEGVCTKGEEAGVFVPETSGTYYFVIKTGNTDWEGNNIEADILLDEVSLMAAINVPEPVAEFFADVTSGTAPLTVYFTDQSENATAWTWDFGDGGSSTEQHPSYTYTTAGTYTVSLMVTSGDLTDVISKTDLITVDEAVGVSVDTEAGFELYPNPAGDYFIIHADAAVEGRVSMMDMSGRVIREVLMSGQRSEISVSDVNPGIYLVQVYLEDRVINRKLLIE